MMIALLSGITIAALQGQPSVTLNVPAAGASYISGYAYNVDYTRIKVVIYALTNQWYVQCYADEPFTNISADGSWSNCTNPWSVLVVLLVDPATYTPASTEITNPALDPGVLASTQYPLGPASVNFSGYPWGIKLTGNQPGYQFDPGPNFWSNDPSVVSVQADGLHLKIANIGGLWWCGEIYLLSSLGHGTYTVHVNSDLSNLDLNTVAAPMFIYAMPGQELDFEYSGTGGLIPIPNNMQYVVQPYTVPGNILRFNQPSTAQFTSQMEWEPNYVIFRTWKGWSDTPATSDMINSWTYTGSYIPPVGQDRVHINLWLLNGNAPVSGVGDQMVVNSFNFLLPGVGAIGANPQSLTFNATYSGPTPGAQAIDATSIVSAVNFTVASDSPWLTTPTATGITPSQVNVTAAPGTMTPGAYNGNITLTSGVNAVRVPVTLSITETGSPCDTNQNGTINVASVQKIVNEALGIMNATNDLNRDGVVNVVDAQIVADAALGLGCLSH